MLCPNCGHELPEGTWICPNCGTDAEDINTQGFPDDIAVEPRIGAETKDKKAAFGRRGRTLKPVFREAGDEVMPESSDPAPDGNREDESGDESDTEQSGLKTAVAIISAAIFIAGGVLVYRNLPESRYSRYMKNAREAYESRSYSEAASAYRRALEIHPDSEEALADMEEIYGIVMESAAEACREGRFEDGAEEARILFIIKPEAVEQNTDMLETAYRSWATYLVEQGTEAEVDALLEQASAELPQDSIERIRQDTDNAYLLMDLSGQLTAVADRIKTADAGSDQVTVFIALEEAYSTLSEYREKGGVVPVRFLDGSDTEGVEFNVDSKGSIQVYIGGFASGRVKSGNARTYLIASAGSGDGSYEFFESVWSENDPNGEFREIDYGNGPGESPTGTITGTLKDGHYDGDIRNTRGDVTYGMKFSDGKVVVLDTVDPNGDSNNVVGYTDDGDNWLVFSDSALNSRYGVRYLR